MYFNLNPRSCCNCWVSSKDKWTSVVIGWWGAVAPLVLVVVVPGLGIPVDGGEEAMPVDWLRGLEGEEERGLFSTGAQPPNAFFYESRKQKYDEDKGARIMAKDDDKIGERVGGEGGREEERHTTKPVSSDEKELETGLAADLVGCCGVDAFEVTDFSKCS
jgi:hypothetical protein